MNTMAINWRVWIVRGVASILFGALTVLWPGASIAAIVLMYGVYALADGALLLGFGLRAQGGKVPYIVRGLVSLAAGIVALVFPGVTAVSLYVLIGAWALAAGAAEIALAVALKKDVPSIGGLVLAGILSLACGVALLALPLMGMIALVGLIAGYAIANGVVLIVAGVRIHGVTQAIAAQ